MSKLLTNPSRNTDVLSHILQLLHFKSHVFFHSTYCGRWAVDSSGTGRSTFHLVSGGNCWLHMPELESPIKLEAGDFLVFPFDAQHAISDSHILDVDTIGQECPEDGNKKTALVCGYFMFDMPTANPVINSLPKWMLVKCEQAGIGFRLEQLSDMIRSEIDSQTPGKEVIIDRLTELLFIQVIRHYLNTGELADKGLLAALADKRISYALQAFHTMPGHGWSVEKLADAAHLSRSAFSSLFTQILGEPPMQYVTYWRMQLAYSELLTTRKPIADIAELIGYQSETAFRKTFKQVMGITPSMARNRAASQQE
ncbi:AraC family transcriptional regulator [Thiothrix nivea]|uniref:Transcriptional regulator, AraC family n=1 Tax=Thiothrix nivea (strain ATCC 35100 / DSM 5205 / JP2) TaxID=870187 RepID=A0A656HEV8_THINJ|nr:AraC family transcriptional regulator [Thiothrix nivea]EIJ35458.1 transcriptional regulator, AraC family [Thiothrix nivea DSM 5205]